MREDNKHCANGGHHFMHSHHDGSLGDLLDSCGHYFAHRVGGSRRGQGNVLALIGRNPGITQKELTEKLGIQPASVSELLMKLERKGAVVREKDENDRRVVRVRLTEAGEKALVKPDTEATDPFQVLTAEEQETLKMLLGKLLADWEARYPVERNRNGGRHDGHRGHGEGQKEEHHRHDGHRHEGQPDDSE